jgi:hypothetical protein
MGLPSLSTTIAAARRWDPVGCRQIHRFSVRSTDRRLGHALHLGCAIAWASAVLPPPSAMAAPRPRIEPGHNQIWPHRHHPPRDGPRRCRRHPPPLSCLGPESGCWRGRGREEERTGEEEGRGRCGCAVVERKGEEGRVEGEWQPSGTGGGTVLILTYNIYRSTLSGFLSLYGLPYFARWV